MADGGPSAGAAGATGTPTLLTLGAATDLRIELLENGSIFAIRHGEILVTQVLGSPLEGGPGGLFLRRRAGNDITWAPLIGPASPLSLIHI